MESIPGLLKCLQIQAQATCTLASGIGSMESIPGLLKRLQIRAQATLASGIGSLESIPGLLNLKKEEEGNFFWIERNIFVLIQKRLSLSSSFMLWSQGINSKEPIPLANVA